MSVVNTGWRYCGTQGGVNSRVKPKSKGLAGVGNAVAMQNLRLKFFRMVNKQLDMI